MYWHQIMRGCVSYDTYKMIFCSKIWCLLNGMHPSNNQRHSPRQLQEWREEAIFQRSKLSARWAKPSRFWFLGMWISIKLLTTQVNIPSQRKAALKLPLSLNFHHHLCLAFHARINDIQPRNPFISSHWILQMLDGQCVIRAIVPTLLELDTSVWWPCIALQGKWLAC